MSSLKQESGQSSKMVLENGDSSSLTTTKSKSKAIAKAKATAKAKAKALSLKQSLTTTTTTTTNLSLLNIRLAPLEVSSSVESSSTGESSTGDSSSNGDSSSGESSSDDSSGDSDQKSIDWENLKVDSPKASKKVYFTEEYCRWTMIKHPVSVKRIRNFVQTASNAYVDVDFKGEVTRVDITLGDDPKETLQIGMRASEERNCVTVAEEYQPDPMGCALTDDLGDIGSYNPCTGDYPPEDYFGTSDYSLNLKKKKEKNGVFKFETVGKSFLRFTFGEKEGKETVQFCFGYGENETDELGFDFEVSGNDLNLNLPSALTTSTPAPLVLPTNLQILHGETVKAPGITIANGTHEVSGNDLNLSSALTTTTTTTAAVVPPTNLQIMHGAVQAPGITKKSDVAKVMPMQKK